MRHTIWQLSKTNNSTRYFFENNVLASTQNTGYDIKYFLGVTVPTLFKSSLSIFTDLPTCYSTTLLVFSVSLADEHATWIRKSRRLLTCLTTKVVTMHIAEPRDCSMRKLYNSRCTRYGFDWKQQKQCV